ncbi:gamma-glutamyl-gamma-aminobutyrate hydrolase family protein [Aquibaculum arenosum]|uniref:Gamma-glutamyl-gamma-aminobutyrate hydrolase family protein n=1 Tax=Aquibaculum arenosum TaxID=3032591 RepID=A0ABT5YMI0_9PROT|nr:gamma-glutamyl-gamma-aminobutyrate hydrolase family protein [Fodinicurvata sp. CAU 1616]MDF2096048.1 gamma-glutamyl-gamma-aminobutyrate hydrolase family protein [Fodinicurvata sp. CAU 1616]
MQRKPLIGLPACVRSLDGQSFHTIGDKYVRAVALAADAVPVMLPSLGELLDIPAALEGLDGVLLTGSPSNVHPSHFGQEATPEHAPHDEARDATTLPLIEATLAAGLPLFAICRGMQELNVALGGTLHPRVHELSGRLDHRRPQHDDMDVQYGKRHSIALTPGGLLHAVAGAEMAEVNSLHWQAVDRLAPRLSVNATAPDDTIEAVEVRDAKGFALGVQWHPEYKVMDDPLSVAIFQRFAAEARAYGERKGR